MPACPTPLPEHPGVCQAFFAFSLPGIIREEETFIRFHFQVRYGCAEKIPPNSMKRLLFLPLALLTTLCAARADTTIVQKIDGMAGVSTESTIKIKGDKMRVDATAGMTMVLNGGSGEILNIMHSQKSFMKIPAALATAAFSSMAGKQAEAATKPKLTPTGKKDTINTYACSEYTTDIAGKKVNMWLTTALPNYQAALKELTNSMNKGPLAAAMQSFNVYTDDLPGFPIRTTSEVESGQTITATTVSVDTKPLADADFAVPAGYKEMTMPTLTPPAAAGTPATR